LSLYVQGDLTKAALLTDLTKITIDAGLVDVQASRCVRAAVRGSRPAKGSGKILVLYVNSIAAPLCDGTHPHAPG
jgi:hypothetical protein